MEPKAKLAKIIKGRTCCVISKGKSLEELEEKIELFRDKDVCWVVHNKFDYIEDLILKKIGKKADIISDCATVAKIHVYEPDFRLPSFLEFLGRGEQNLLAISKLVIEECFGTCDRLDAVEQYESRIVTIDSIFEDPNCPKEVWEPPPHSLTLLLAFLIAGQAQKIILFGIDGAKEGIEFLRENKHEILWVRAPYWKCFGWADVRREWLETNFEMLSRKEAFFPTEDKHLVGALSIIDDRADIVKKHQLHNPDSIGYIFRSELNLHSGEQLVDWKKIMTMEFFHYEKPNY